MRLLILTQKVDKNDPILGFFHRWIIEFAKNCESITVICLQKGQYDLPENVRVLSLGKEKEEENTTSLSRIKYIINFYKYIWKERGNYDNVFIHMNQVYVILGGIFWKLLNKKISLWYTHKQVSLSLRIAEKLVDNIFTASKESFGLNSKKVHIVGHGIDIERFINKNSSIHDSFNIISVGRITRIKNLEILINTSVILENQGFDFSYTVIGPTVTQDDKIYFEELKKIPRSKNFIFKDAVTHEELARYYWNSDININLAPTGGVDKVVLEGIVAGVIPIVMNKTFTNVFDKYSDILITDNDTLVDKVKNIYHMSNKKEIIDFLQKKVIEDYDVKNVVKKILKIINI